MLLLAGFRDKCHDSGVAQPTQHLQDQTAAILCQLELQLTGRWLGRP